MPTGNPTRDPKNYTNVARFIVLVGDFNDNPDDQSLNILETGNAGAAGGEENIPGTFMINLTEPLLALGHVSYGLNSADIISGTDFVDTIDSGSRGRNNDHRGTNINWCEVEYR